MYSFSHFELVYHYILVLIMALLPLVCQYLDIVKPHTHTHDSRNSPQAECPSVYFLEQNVYLSTVKRSIHAVWFDLFQSEHTTCGPA